MAGTPPASPRDEDVIQYQEVDAPNIGEDDVLNKISTVGINHFDMPVPNGKVPNASVKFPHVLGAEGAGTVAQIGQGVTGFGVGELIRNSSC